MKTLNNKLVYSFLFVTIFSILQPVLLFSQNSTKSRIVDPVKQWHRIEGAIAATRYPFLGATEKEWPSDYRTVVNGFQENFGLNGPEGMGFIYPGIVIFDGRGNIKEIVLVEMADSVDTEKARTWKFLSTCKNSDGSMALFSLYVPREVKGQTFDIIRESKIDNCSLHTYHVVGGYLEVDGSLVHNVFISSSDKKRYEAEILDSQKVTSEVQRNRVVRINAATGYPYLDQGDNSWSPAFRVVVNDEIKRFGIQGPDDMGMIYPSIIILDEGDQLECFGLIEPAENESEERSKVWKFLSEILDNPASYKFLFIHVPHGLEEKAYRILKKNNIAFAGLRGYSILDNKLLITIRTFEKSIDNR
jgi:hypothetical protein